MWILQHFRNKSILKYVICKNLVQNHPIWTHLLRFSNTLSEPWNFEIQKYSLISVWTNPCGLIVLGAIVVRAVIKSSIPLSDRPPSPLVHKMPIEAGEWSMLGTFSLYKQWALLYSKLLQISWVWIHILTTRHNLTPSATSCGSTVGSSTSIVVIVVVVVVGVGSSAAIVIVISSCWSWIGLIDHWVLGIVVSLLGACNHHLATTGCRALGATAWSLPHRRAFFPLLQGKHDKFLVNFAEFFVECDAKIKKSQNCSNQNKLQIKITKKKKNSKKK